LPRIHDAKRGLGLFNPHCGHRLSGLSRPERIYTYGENPFLLTAKIYQVPTKNLHTAGGGLVGAVLSLEGTRC